MLIDNEVQSVNKGIELLTQCEHITEYLENGGSVEIVEQVYLPQLDSMCASMEDIDILRTMDMFIMGVGKAVLYVVDKWIALINAILNFFARLLGFGKKREKKISNIEKTISQIGAEQIKRIRAGRGDLWKVQFDKSKPPATIATRDSVVNIMDLIVNVESDLNRLMVPFVGGLRDLNIHEIEKIPELKNVKNLPKNIQELQNVKLDYHGNRSSMATLGWSKSAYFDTAEFQELLRTVRQSVFSKWVDNQELLKNLLKDTKNLQKYMGWTDQQIRTFIQATTNLQTIMVKTAIQWENVMKVIEYIYDKQLQCINDWYDGEDIKKG